MARIKILMTVIVCALILSACGKEPMPEVNDANCQYEKMKEIKDKETRYEFARLCQGRSKYVPLENPKKTWDELFAPADQGK